MRIFTATLFLLNLLWASSLGAQCDMEVEISIIQQPYCSQDTDGALSATTTGGTPPYTYQWSNGANAETITGLAPGIYSITVTDAEDCEAFAEVELKTGLVADAGEDQVVYCEGSVEVGTSPIYTPALWFSDDVTSIVFSDNDQSVIDFEGISGYITANPIEPDQPQQPDALHLYIGSAATQNGEEICLPVTVGNFEDVVGFAFTLNYDPLLLQLNEITNLNLDIPNFNSATNFTTPPDLPLGFIAVSYFDSALLPSSLPDGDTLFQMCFTVIGNPQDLTHEWASTNNFTDDNPITSVTESGTYTLRVTDNSQPDCWVEDEVEVTFLDSLIVNIGDTLYYCDTELYTLSAEIQGGSGNFEYAWSTGENTPTIEVTPSPGDRYYLTANESDGDCIGMDSVVMMPAAPVEIAPMEDVFLCEGEAVTVQAVASGGVPPYDYTWSDGQIGNPVTLSFSGTYFLSVTDVNGCFAVDSVEVFEFGAPEVQFAEDTIAICAGELATLDAIAVGGQPPFVYEWPTGEIGNPITVGPSSTTTYTISITDSNGCQGVGDVTVLVNELDIEIDVSVCDNNGTLSDPADDTFTFNIIVSGGSSEMWTGLIGGELFSGFYDIPYSFGPFLIADGNVELNLSDSDNPSCNQNGTAVTPGCEIVTCFFESVNSTILSCDNNNTPDEPDDDIYEIEFIVTNTTSLGDGYSLELFGEQYSGTYDVPLLITDTLPINTYDITITDDVDNSCDVNSSVTITGCDINCEDTNLNITVTIIDVSCHGGFDACIEALVTGGTPPYIYEWHFGATSNPVCNLPAGDYNLTVTDANGCNAEAGVTISEPAPLLITIEEANTPTCENSSDGALEVFVTGGTPPYGYQWSTGANAPLLSGLAAGIYTITITDVNGCSNIQSYELLPATIADAGPDMILNCVNTAVLLDGSNSSTGPDITYEWVTSDGNILAGANTLTPQVDAPGTYELIVTNNSEPDCHSRDEVVVTADFLQPIVSFNFISCDSANLFFSPAIADAAISWTFPDGSIVEDENPVGTTQSGTYLLEIIDLGNGCSYEESITLTLDPASCTTLKGRLVRDTIADCIPLPDEPGLSNWLLAIEGGGEVYYAVTQADGYYEQQVPAGTYEVYPILPSDLWLSCQNSYTVSLPNPGDMEMQDIPIQEQEPCPDLSVDFSMPIMRACWTRSIYIHYCNNGTALAEDAYVEVTLDENFTFQSASLPVAGQDGNTFTFNVGDIEINDCGSFVVTFDVSCEVEVGQALCAEAKIFPNGPCTMPSPLWSGASLSVSSNCDEEFVAFTIQNEGSEDMELPAACIVIEDGVMLFVEPDSLKLDSGESYDYQFPANGSTYRLEIEQVPFHPGFSMPLAVVEGCGENSSGGFSTGFVNQFAMDDEDEFIDVECREVVASYDPNDKHGFPRGYGEDHLIYPGTPMEYLVNFQNTGNDTAFLVVIRDTLSEHLDITSVRPGGASHSYTWDIDGDNVLVFTFDNILLPDSTTNLAGSQGFIEYKVNQVAGLPLGTVIENNAAIYFDINDPIITNTIMHKLGKDFIEVANLVIDPALADASVKVIPNPAQEEAQFILSGWPSGTNTFELFDLRGQRLLQQSFDGTNYQFRRGQLAEGLYFFRIRSSEGYEASGQLMLAR